MKVQQTQTKSQTQQQTQIQNMNYHHCNNNLIQTITNADLRNNKNGYTMAEIMFNLNQLDLKTLLNTQQLSADFCKNYIMNDNYVTCTEDQYLFCESYVLSRQAHLAQNDFF